MNSSIGIAPPKAGRSQPSVAALFAKMKKALPKRRSSGNNEQCQAPCVSEWRRIVGSGLQNGWMNDASQCNGSWNNEGGCDGKYDVEGFSALSHGEHSVNRRVLSFKI